MTRSFPATINETLEYIERALARIQEGDGAETEAHNIRAYLLNTLELIERDPGIEAAADDLYATATACVAGQARPEDGLQRRDAESRAKRFSGCETSLPPRGRTTTREAWTSNEQRL